ncbi:MAG TPA: tetratricopeptide repeat protein [Kiritimatiellia bacterium]|mgnify:CR=1 FL=1|nr:tetratricopeptide repeat protein [Kiritimatiellia bacterium]HPW76109.1 tetratricopeptide repeat protein [Kiritimatiellia bacterium]HRU20254.1 tetratricopeptide repeat protein [Kiritimatiellia bacterium]
MRRLLKDEGVRLACVSAGGSVMAGVWLAEGLRVLDTFAGRTAPALAACAAVGVVGLTTGVLAAARPARRVRHAARWMSGTLLMCAVALVTLLAILPAMSAGWQRLVGDLSRTFGDYLLAVGKTALVLFFVPAVLAGVAARFALAAVRTERTGAGQELTLCLLLGLLPAVFGFGFGRTVLASAVDTETLLRLGALWCGALASFLVHGRGLSAALPFAAVAVLLAAVRPATGPGVLAEGLFARLVHRDSGFARGTPVFAHRTRHHTVALFRDDDYETVLTLDGRPVLFGNRFHTARTLTGLLPALLHPASAKVVVLGPEAGLYLPFVFRAGVTNVAVAGSDRAVVELALAADRLVTGGDAVDVRQVKRRVRLTRRAGYDLIFLAGEPLWLRGTRGSVDAKLFKRCRAALSDDGIVALHLDARALPMGRFVSVARRFTAVFSEVQVWQTGSDDWLLIGATRPFEVRAERMLERFERREVMRDCARAGIRSLPEILACRVGNGPAWAAWLERASGSSVKAGIWRAPRTAFSSGAADRLRAASLDDLRPADLDWLRPGALDDATRAALLDKAGVCREAHRLAASAFLLREQGRGEAALQAAREAARLHPGGVLLTPFGESLDLEGRRRIAIGDFKGALKCYENLLSLQTGLARAHYGMAYCLRATGEAESAYLHFARAVAAAPTQISYRLAFAQACSAVGEYAEADRQYEAALRQEPDNPELLFRFARGLALAARPEKDFARAIRLAERACVVTRWRHPEYAYGLADLYLDAGRVLEGMGLKRRLKEGLISEPGVPDGKGGTR